MNIQVALQNTLVQFEGIDVNHIRKEGTLWTIKITKGDAEMEFEVDETVCVVCLLQRKNLGLKSVSRFMNVFVEEIERIPVDEDPVNPMRD
jgi:hypothetical protein